jgi:hypothetical protein
VIDDQPREVATLRRLHELMCRVNAGDDLASVLQTVVNGVADVTGFAVAAVSYRHPDRHFEVVAVAGDDACRDSCWGPGPRSTSSPGSSTSPTTGGC